uniref:NADH-ubiquinone oxidoreductase chain 5 n=1 Tax=Calotomus japonicus TaxID=242801 RepID=A0A347Z640_9LABR|nr:NADH dehydrogenase subunit 5 [Calotomus japonicus]BAZ95735.1 NADH dehydrogenase subunit 5 [Calotomus japonicus]
MLNNLLATVYITMVLVLLYPLLSPFFLSSLKMKPATGPQVEMAVIIAFFLSLIPLLVLISNSGIITLSFKQWIDTPIFDICLCFKFDSYSALFLPVAFFVTWSIVQFTAWYMERDPGLNNFFKFLLSFLAAMVVLVTANNMCQIFIGWEGVGIMSFLLIGWWSARSDANTAGLQAVVYNRVGDIGFMLALAWTAIKFAGWELDYLLTSMVNEDVTLPLLALVLGAVGKSAQFGLHPWLPSAMEGPTPVSALLHSSTMVVAGIFVLIRFSPLIQQNPFVLSVCLWIGALTTVFTAGCALTQNDIKKIIAFSTASQLGLMMVTIGLAQPDLAFFHICTHAFFKAMLFLCAGVVIHALNDEQDIRKMGGLQQLLPFTSSCMSLGSLALAGTPYLSGFYSKDAIIEALNTSYSNACALALTLIATSFTAVYSLRIAYYVSMCHPRILPYVPIAEDKLFAMPPLKRLAYGSIVAGFILTSTVLPTKTPVMTMSFDLKVAALAVSILGLVIALQLAHMASTQSKDKPSLPLHRFSSMLGFFPTIVHRLVPLTSLVFGQRIANQLIDYNWLEKIGPKIIKFVNIKLSRLVGNAQQGKIKTYFLFMCISFYLILIYYGKYF